MEYTSIKFIPTGNIFKMPTKDAAEILKNDRGNYEIVDGKDIPEEKEEIQETTTYEKVVEEETETEITEEVEEETEAQNEQIEEINENTLKKMKVPELIQYCENNNIKFEKDDKKNDLIQKILNKEE